MKRKIALICCKNKYCIQKNRRCLQRHEHIYLVSSDFGVKKFESSNVKFVPYDSDQSFFCEDTWHIIKTLNKEIEGLELCGPAYLYQESCLIEGGFAQNIADVLYSIDIFKKIIIDKDISIIYCDRNCELPDVWALQSIAASMKIKFCYLSGGADRKTGLKRWIYHADLRGVREAVALKANINSLINIIKISRENRENIKNEEKQYDIGIILVSNANKHINWLLNSLKNYDTKLCYCIFCMKADKARKELQKYGKEAKSVEAYYKTKFLLQSIPIYLKDVHLITRTIRKSEKRFFQDIDIKKVVNKLYLKKLREEKLSNVIYERIIMSFLQKNRVYLLTGDGDTNFISNQIFYNIIQKLKMNTLFYKDNTGLEIINVEGKIFEPYSYITDFRFFTRGSKYLEALLAGGWKGKFFYLSDLTYADAYNKYDMIEQNINQKVHILWAPSYPVKGHYSMKNFILDNEFIIKECKNKDFELYIKYHPNQDDALVQDYIKENKDIRNIHFINKQESIEPYIEKSDIVITTPSTVIIDAALKKKLVICLVDFKSYQLVSHIEGGFIIRERETLQISEYVKIAMEKLEQNSKYENYLKKQKSFIRTFFECDNDMNDINDIFQSIIVDIKENR